MDEITGSGPINQLRGLPSALSTSGAGTIFEYRVAAVALAAMLCRKSIVGLGGPVESVGLQQRPFGHFLDDITARGHTGVQKLITEYQVKRSVDPVPSSESFRDVVQQCLGAIESDPHEIASGHHRLGLIAGGKIGSLRQLQRIGELARSHFRQDAFNAAMQPEARAIKNRRDKLRTTIKSLRPDVGDEELDDLTWKIARALTIWFVDDSVDDRDIIRATNDLRDQMLSESLVTGEQVFIYLAHLAQQWAPQSATVDVGMLRTALEGLGVGLSLDPWQRQTYARLAEWSDSFRRSVPGTIGRELSLPREEIQSQVVREITSHDVLVLTGPAGVGKTALALRAIRTLQEAGAVVIALSLSQIGEPLHRWEANLNLSLHRALAGAPTGTRRVLFIDGAEQALTDGSVLLTGILRAVPRDSAFSPTWCVMLTARDEAADVLTSTSGIEEALGAKPRRVRVGDLMDEEVRCIIDAFPLLAPLDRYERSRRLLRRPYVADVLVRANSAASLSEPLLGEEDVVDVVDRQLVRRANGARHGQGEPTARRDAYLALARVAVEQTLPASLDGRDAAARQGLVSDDIFSEMRGGYRFAHDILRDYAVVTWLLEQRENWSPAQLPAPRSHLRTMRLWMQHRLTHANDLTQEWPDIWEAAQTLADTDGSRWLDVPFEAVLHLGRTREVMAGLGQIFLANEGELLEHLLDVVDRLAVLSRSHDKSGPPLLDIGLAAPVVEFLAKHAVFVPDNLREAASRVTARFLAGAVGPDVSIADFHIDLTALADAFRAWRPNCEQYQFLQVLAKATAMLGDGIDDESERFLLKYACEHPSETDVVVEDPLVSCGLARQRPNLLLSMAGAYYIDTLLTMEGGTSVLECRGDPVAVMRKSRVMGIDAAKRNRVRGHGILGAGVGLGIGALVGPQLGPFRIMLTECAPQGLRLIGALVDVATEDRIGLESQWGHTEDMLELQLADWEAPRVYRGTQDVWCWYRCTTVGPYPALSALLALRTWSIDQVNAGVSIRRVIENILQSGQSLALVAVALSVLIQFLERLPEEINVFLEHPLVWHLERERASREISPFAFPDENAPRITWTLSQIAMDLVWRGDFDMRSRLIAVGEKLRHNPEPISALVHGNSPENDAQRMMAFRKQCAASLDIANYREQRVDGGIMISLDSDTIDQDHAETHRMHTLRALDCARLAYDAMEIRDGAGEGDPVPIWNQLILLRDTSGDNDIRSYPLSPRDALAAGASAILIKASAGDRIADSILSDATVILQSVAEEVGTESVSLRHRDAMWSLGADRSAAVALPVLLLNEDLRQRAGIEQIQLEKSLVALAQSVFREVRENLVSALAPAWNREDSFTHAVCIKIATELLATTFLGPWDSSHSCRYRAKLERPVEEVLADETKDMMLDAASDALPLLMAAEMCRCDHCSHATIVLDALVERDLRVWPTKWARQGFLAKSWRQLLDRRTAMRILDGDRSYLHRYLAVFAPVGEQLGGLLEALAENANTEARIKMLQEVWGAIFEALLPNRRALDIYYQNGPHYSDVQRLDSALLPILPDDVPWTTTDMAQLFWCWVDAYEDHPQVGDRCIQFLVNSGWIASPNSVDGVLRVLGTNHQAISGESALVVEWLKFALLQPQMAGTNGGRLRRLLDGLAGIGNPPALALQQHMESV